MGGRREAALIVDVDEQFRRALSKCLTSEFCFRDLVEAASVEAALELLGECGPFRIAVFDLFTLGEDSADNLRSLRACFPDMPIAIVSASTARRDILAALEAGVHGYIPKAVRRQNIWLRLGLRLAEFRPHHGVDIKRRSCGAASVDVG